VNHPITGPIVSGPHLKPFICTTKESGLGEPLDENCSAATKIEYFYKPKEGTAFNLSRTRKSGGRPRDHHH
jgi:hypothetical protein